MGGFVDTLENDEIHDSDTSGVCVKQLVWAGPPPTHTPVTRWLHLVGLSLG